MLDIEKGDETDRNKDTEARTERQRMMTGG